MIHVAASRDNAVLWSSQGFYFRGADYVLISCTSAVVVFKAVLLLFGI